MDAISVVFEAGQKNATPNFRHTQLLTGNSDFRDRFRIKDVTIEEKAGVTPFQLADLFVYELFKYDAAGGPRGLASPRYPLIQFDEHVPFVGRRFTEEQMHEYYEIYNEYMRGAGTNYV